MNEDRIALGPDDWDDWLGGMPLGEMASRLGIGVGCLRRSLRAGQPDGRRPVGLLAQGGMALWVAASGMPDIDGMPCPCLFLRTPRAYPPHHVDRALATMASRLAALVPGATLDGSVVEAVDRDACDAMQARGYLTFAMDEDGDAWPAPSPDAVAT